MAEARRQRLKGQLKGLKEGFWRRVARKEVRAIDKNKAVMGVPNEKARNVEFSS